MISPVLAVAGRYALAVSLVVAVALLVKGYTAAGDGFAAGAVVAVALGLQIVAGGREQASRQPLLRHAGAIALGGLTLALAVWGGAFAKAVDAQTGRFRVDNLRNVDYDLIGPKGWFFLVGVLWPLALPWAFGLAGANIAARRCVRQQIELDTEMAELRRTQLEVERALRQIERDAAGGEGASAAPARGAGGIHRGA